MTILGGGTNVLVSDRGVRGLVVRLGRASTIASWEVDDDGSTPSSRLARPRGSRLAAETVQRGYGGIEFAAGIPGSVGGGAQMNAGAFGGELGDTIERISGARSTEKLSSSVRSTFNSPIASWR